MTIPLIVRLQGTKEAEAKQCVLYLSTCRVQPEIDGPTVLAD